MLPGSNSSENSPAIWTAALNTSVIQTKSKGRVKKSEIIHFPEFINAAQYLTDPYWVDVFNACAKKKLPRGFSYLNRHLKHRTNDITIALPDDPQFFAQTAVHFFRENGKLYSKRDQELRKKIEEQAVIDQLSRESSDWTKVARSKNRRTMHVREYVDRKYSHLTKNQRDELFTQINIGFETKYITKDHITFENGLILNIDGFEVCEDDITFTRSIPSWKIITHVPEDPVREKKYQHYENWCKYFEDFLKHAQESTRSSHTYQTVTCSDDGSNSDQLIIHSN